MYSNVQHSKMHLDSFALVNKFDKHAQLTKVVK